MFLLANSYKPLVVLVPVLNHVKNFVKTHGVVSKEKFLGSEFK